MCNLLRAGFFKLRKSSVFFGMIIVAILIGIMRVGSEIIASVLDSNLDNILIGSTNIIAFVIAVFMALFTGMEHNERNY